MGNFHWMGLPQASNMAGMVDGLYGFIAILNLLGLEGVTVAMIYFMVRHRRSVSDPDKTPLIEGHTPSELTVSLLLFVLVMVIFYWGWIDYKKMLSPPSNAMEINVTGRQWMWQFEYTNGHKLLGELVLPKDRPVKLLMNSEDVLHSFFVPEFRIKQDLVPGAYTSVHFTPTILGEFTTFCAEYCGTSHSQMLAKIKVVSAQDYDQWQKKWEWTQRLGISEAQASPGSSALSPVARGQKLFSEKGCNACHTTTGQSLVGPSFKGIFGHEVELAGGAKATVDENYLRASLMDPTLEIVKGFQPIMPTYRGTLSDDEVNALVAYIKSL